MTSLIQLSAPNAPYVQVSAPNEPQTAARKHMIGLLTLDEGQSPTIRAQVKDADGGTVVRSEVEYVDLTITDVEDAAVSLWEESLDPANVFETAAQTGSEWWSDSTGYTFEHQITAADDLILEGGKRYRVEYRIVLTSSPADVLWIKADLITRPVYARRS